jgi:aerotaxis receptor
MRPKVVFVRLLSVSMEPPERFVDSHELFFSTTDRRGVITSGNSVFERVSGYTLDELVGSPHNIVRHPDMPGAAFAIMWRRLAEGSPMAAYVANRTKAGATYWVFATVTPVPDGYLSVRVAPRSSLLPRVRELYAAVARFEADARAAGMTRAEAAAAGVGDLTRRLADLGYDSYEDLMDEALPLEVAARAHLIRERLERPGAGGPAGSLLVAAHLLHEDLAGVIDRLDEYGRLASALADTASEALMGAQQLRGTVAAARGAGEHAAAVAPVLGSVATAMDGLAEQARESLESLVSDLRSTAELVARLRFQAALSGLHNDMAAAFAAEMVDGVAGPRTGVDVGHLAQALRSSLAELSVAVPRANARVLGLGAHVDEAVARFTKVRSFAGKWCSLVYQRGMGPELGRYVDLIDADLARGQALLAELGRVGASSRERVADLDLVRLGSRLDVLQGAAVA